MKKILLLSLLLISSCEKDNLKPCEEIEDYNCYIAKDFDELQGEYVCIDNNCDASFGISTAGSVLGASTPLDIEYISPDENGYFNIYLNFEGEYWPWFKIDAYATKLKKEWLINGVPFVTAGFTSDKAWVIGDTLTYSVPLYRPYGGLTNSSGQMIPEQTNEVTLTQFAGIEVNLVQNAAIYFSERGNFLWSRRVVGPVPPFFVGDTATIAMRIQWREKVYKNYEEKFIFHDINQN